MGALRLAACHRPRGKRGYLTFNGILFGFMEGAQGCIGREKKGQRGQSLVGFFLFYLKDKTIY